MVSGPFYLRTTKNRLRWRYFFGPRVPTWRVQASTPAFVSRARRQSRWAHHPRRSSRCGTESPWWGTFRTVFTKAGSWKAAPTCRGHATSYPP